MEEEQQNQNQVQLRLVLEGEGAKKFIMLKKKYGVLKNVELVRILIEQEYQRQFGSERFR
jgi:hypothetical protein